MADKDKPKTSAEKSAIVWRKTAELSREVAVEVLGEEEYLRRMGLKLQVMYGCGTK
jgi:hypothetical protein